jgi:inhibitor of KinA
VVRIHSGTNYLVYMMGFSPGFPYLGGMSGRIATPRLTTPRTAIPAGSVGIAQAQTGIYPVESPGGWRLIGRTPIQLFDPVRQPPVLVEAGDYIRFVPISAREYRRLEATTDRPGL